MEQVNVGLMKPNNGESEDPEDDNESTNNLPIGMRK